MYERVKRAADLFASAVSIVVLSPVYLLVALIIKAEDPSGPVFFRQARVGRNGRKFRIFKFRSMREQTRDDKGRLLSDAERMLRIGWTIRKLSVDELPQMLNILKGDMSFIGPRPLPEKYLDYYTHDELARHDVRPGISGWAQVNGRNMLSWDEKLSLDLDYVEHLSLGLDVKVLVHTIGNVLGMRGVGTRGVEIPDISLHEIRQKRREP